jgi:hypothetical protein
VSVGAKPRFAACTLTGEAADELDAKVLFALNTAVIACEPFVREAVLKTA